MSITRDTRINLVNIGLMIISCIAAFIMPFEVFLFAYAFLGPLHYLTEISWLHDRQYFTKGKYDFWFLVFLCLLITFEYVCFRYELFGKEGTESVRETLRGWNIGDKMLFLALFGAAILAFVKNLYAKIAAIAFIFIIANGVFVVDPENPEPPSTIELLLTAFVPTLIHVYVFTGIFMLFGALKSRSKSGLWSIVVFILCPIVLVTLFRGQIFVPVTNYGMKAYGDDASRDGFFDLSKTILGNFFNPVEIAKTLKGVDLTKMTEAQIWKKLVYESNNGIFIIRFIAFAYTYHYLNWFSKTEIIRWHQVPKARFIAVIALWIASLTIYAFDYALGLQVLFFLSFSHVLLEFPLNFTSFVGVIKETSSILKNGFALPAAKK